MDFKEEYNKWLSSSSLDDSLREELLSIDEDEIEDRFYTELDFGTAGIRGLLGAGTNRMNIHTVAQVTEGLANKVLDSGHSDRGVVIGCDVRHMSREFSELIAGILSHKGIKVYLFEDVAPTPLLSYAVRNLKAIAGVMITASHNPKDYNGYKVYWEDGSQISTDVAKEVREYISDVEDIFSIKFDSVEEGLKSGLIEYVDESVIESYKSKVLNLSVNDEIDKDLSIVYSPLHGAGYKLVPEVLHERGFENVHIVSEQSQPDPDFSTSPYPNPENEDVFDYAVELGIKNNADLLITTDPDVDRAGVMISHNGQYRFLNGNILGLLLANYMLTMLSMKNELSEKDCIVKTIVTEDLIDKVADHFNVNVLSTHVGFKNIYALAEEWETTEQYNYIMGYEESLGFGIGKDIARDKDAISASMMIAEMAAYYKKRGQSLVDVLNELYEMYGFHFGRLESLALEGIDGQDKIKKIVNHLRETETPLLSGQGKQVKIDYLSDDTELERLNVLKYMYDDVWFVVRPSGTEPKLKLYVYGDGKTMESAEKTVNEVTEEILSLFHEITSN